MGAAIDNVHHRDGEHVRRNAAHIAVERKPARIRRCFGYSKTNAEDCVRAQTRLIFGAV